MRDKSKPTELTDDIRIVTRIATVSEIDVLCEIDLDASGLFEDAGLHLNLAPSHEFTLAERSRWLRCLAADTTVVAVTGSGECVGFAAVGVLDAQPYLDQLSVRRAFMRRGIGSVLLSAAVRMREAAGGSVLWLTTYSHLPWNRQFYERNGFEVVPDKDCGPEMTDEAIYQKRWLPMPEQRVVMRRTLRP